MSPTESCDSTTLVVNDWFVSSEMPAPSFTCAEGDRFDPACFGEGVFCLGNTDD
jgi:hypothetical protein